MVFIWLNVLFVIFSFQVFAGDVIVTVDRFKQNNEAAVKFSICDSEKLERSGILGIPQEPVGFSRLDVQKIRRHPKWDDVKFHVGENDTSVMVHLVDKFGL